MSRTNELSSQATLARWGIFVGLAIAGTVVDLWSKSAVFAWLGLPGTNPPHWIVDGYFGIQTAVNPGALFGLGAGFGSVFAGLSIVATIGIIVWLIRFRAIESWWLVAALGLVTSGIFGNLYDRLGMWNPPASMPSWSSGVRDWILIQASPELVWPNFNLADSFLVVGAIMLAVHSFLMTEANDQPTKQQGAKPSTSK